MIPKKLHYIWFGGGEKNETFKRCYESWQKYMPDWEIIEWNEERYAGENRYFCQMLEKKKWAFASDYARFDILYKHGGIYLDTDVEMLKPLNFERAFVGLSQRVKVGSAVVGVPANYPLMAYVRDTMRHEISPEALTRSINDTMNYDIDIYEEEYFYPMNCKIRQKLRKQGEEVKKENFITAKSYTFHWTTGSWVKKNKEIKNGVE